MYAGRIVTPQIEGSTSNIEMGGERLLLCPESYVKSVRAQHGSTLVGASPLLCDLVIISRAYRGCPLVTLTPSYLPLFLSA